MQSRVRSDRKVAEEVGLVGLGLRFPGGIAWDHSCVFWRPTIVALGGDGPIIVFLGDTLIASECDHKAVVLWIGSALGAATRLVTGEGAESLGRGGRCCPKSANSLEVGVAVGVTLPCHWSASPLRWLVVIMPKVGFAVEAIVVPQ
ncbi:hypothetical protein CRG98_034074 [Punica granatum]|uniref:Uncharacterized protein n=1 Tax=Punica granatum TaxID=22663 RepID=A0A2I0IQ52_PUNGR|nr:hypothetical protein CRG98_034074 [Punica granatum]